MRAATGDEQWMQQALGCAREAELGGEVPVGAVIVDATGAVLAAAGTVAAAVRVSSAPALVAAGTLLMAHDWHDRTIWFQRGWQNQP